MLSDMLEMGCEYYVKIHVQGMCHSREKPVIPVICQSFCMLQLFLLSMGPHFRKKKIYNSEAANELIIWHYRTC
jgi:hypothetical protein